MKKIVNMIIKSDHIKRRFLDKVKSQIKKIQKDKQKGHNHDDDDELDDHNDSSNWSYA
jgi:hypothetical protein